MKAYMSYDYSKGSIKSWMFTVLKHNFIDIYRKKKHLLDENQFQMEWIEDPYDAIEHYIKEDQKRWLYSKLFTFPRKERDIMLLSIAWHMNDEEIAERLKMTCDNVRTIRYRTKKKLTELAKKEDYL